MSKKKKNIIENFLNNPDISDIYKNISKIESDLYSLKIRTPQRSVNDITKNMVGRVMKGCIFKLLKSKNFTKTALKYN